MAILSPNPVLTKPRAKKNEMTMSQMTSLVKAEKAVAKGRVLVRTVTVRPKKAHAPTGNGLRTRPAMVETKMERSCQACGVTSGGLGMRNRTIKPTEIERISGIGLAVCVICGDGGGWFGDFVEEEWIGGRKRGLKREEFGVGLIGEKREEEEDRRVGME